MATRRQERRDTAADWTSTDPTLAEGEIGVETDTGLFKIGDGSTAWTSLTYAAVLPVTTTDNAVTRFDGTAGQVQDSGVLIDDSDNVSGIVNLTTTGNTILGDNAADTVGFHGATPVVQAAALTTAETTITYTAPSVADYALQDVTNSSPYGFADAEELRTFIGVVKNLQDRVNELEAALDATTGVGIVA